MVIDPGDNLDLGAAGQEGTGGHVQLPQLHRSAAFPAAVILAPAAARLRLDQAVADQRPVDRRACNGAISAAVHLEHQPPRAPRRVRPPQFTDRFFDLGGDAPGMITDPMAAVLQPRDALLPVAHQPGVHALAADPIPFGDLGHRNTDADLQHGPVSLLDHAQLPQHERSVKHQTEPMCKASSGTTHDPMPMSSPT